MFQTSNSDVRHYSRIQQAIHPPFLSRYSANFSVNTMLMGKQVLHKRCIDDMMLQSGDRIHDAKMTAGLDFFGGLGARGNKQRRHSISSVILMDNTNLQAST
jgi:hypothetical protein